MTEHDAKRTGTTATTAMTVKGWKATRKVVPSARDHVQMLNQSQQVAGRIHGTAAALVEAPTAARALLKLMGLQRADRRLAKGVALPREWMMARGGVEAETRTEVEDAAAATDDSNLLLLLHRLLLHTNIQILLLPYHLCYLYRLIPTDLRLGVLRRRRVEPEPGPQPLAKTTSKVTAAVTVEGR